MFLAPIIGNNCAKKNKKAKNKKGPKDETESEPSKKKKKKPSKDEIGDDDDEEENSQVEPSKIKSVPIKKKTPKKKGQLMNSRMPKQNKGRIMYNPPPHAQRPQHPGFEIPLDPTEDTNTYRQIEGFRDAQNF